MNQLLIEQIDKLTHEAIQQDGIKCDLELEDSDMLLTANSAALLYLAGRVFKLASTGVSGSHFTIDRADMTPDATGSLTIALR